MEVEAGVLEELRDESVRQVELNKGMQEQDQYSLCLPRISHYWTKPPASVEPTGPFFQIRFFSFRSTEEMPTLK